MKNNRYYLGYAWPEDEYTLTSECYETYEEALKAAKKSHKEELSYQKHKRGTQKDEDVQETYVVLVDKDGNEYEMARISGWRSKLEEWEYE